MSDGNPRTFPRPETLLLTDEVPLVAPPALQHPNPIEFPVSSSAPMELPTRGASGHLGKLLPARQSPAPRVSSRAGSIIYSGAKIIDL